MDEKSQNQKRRLSSQIDTLFPAYARKAQLMTNLADERGDFSKLADLSNAELEELISFEKEYIGG